VEKPFRKSFLGLVLLTAVSVFGNYQSPASTPSLPTWPNPSLSSFQSQASDPGPTLLLVYDESETLDLIAFQAEENAPIRLFEAVSCEASAEPLGQGGPSSFLLLPSYFLEGGWSQNRVTFRDRYILQDGGGYRQRSEYFERALSIVDFNNRLREAVNPGGLNIQYSYDPFNRRIMKKTQATGYGLQATVFVWDDQEVVEEYTKADAGSLQLSKQYVPAQSIDQKISANADLNGDGVLEAEYFYLQDQLGNVEAIVDNQGNKLEEYEMSGYGNARIYTPDSTAPQVEQVRTLVDGKLLVLFTEPLYPDSVTSTTVQVLDANQSPLSTVQSLSSDKRLLTIEGTFTEGASYTLKVDGVRDLALNALASTLPPSAFSLGTVLYDTKAPEIERIWQSEGNVFVSFTEDLAPAGVAADAIQIVRNALPATGTATLADGRTIKFTPDQALIPDASYSLSIAPAVTDLTLQPSAFQPIAFDYTPLPVAFFTRVDQRQERSTSAYRNFHLFQGKEQDVETDLLYFRNRFLDFDLGTWITQDPVGYANNYNAYASFSNDSQNRIDPSGLWGFDIHYLATYYLALQAGMKQEDAHLLSWSNQQVDDNWFSQPTVRQALSHPRRVQTFHFADLWNMPVRKNNEFAREMVNRSKERNLFAFGISLHVLADTFSHVGYKHYLWHGYNLTTPDDTTLFADNALLACREVYNYIRDYQTSKGEISHVEFDDFKGSIYRMIKNEDYGKKFARYWDSLMKNAGFGFEPYLKNTFSWTAAAGVGNELAIWEQNAFQFHDEFQEMIGKGEEITVFGAAPIDIMPMWP